MKAPTKDSEWRVMAAVAGVALIALSLPAWRSGPASGAWPWRSGADGEKKPRGTPDRSLPSPYVPEPDHGRTGPPGCEWVSCPVRGLLA